MDAGFEAVYREYGRNVHAYLARLTGDASRADELCQETFLRYLRHRGTLVGRNGMLGAWLFTVATNLARDGFRRRRPPAQLGHEPAAAEQADPVERRDLDERVRAEVQRLPLELREVFVLRVHHELPYARVAEVLGLCESTAKQRFRRAREILAHRLAPLIREDRR